MPDLHPGKGYPVGVAALVDGLVYPHLVGSDIGCGMALFRSATPVRKLDVGRAVRRLRDLEQPWGEDSEELLTTHRVAAYLREELSITRLSSTFGVSRKTAHKWIARYAAGGVAELLNRLRRPQSKPNSMSQEVANLVVTAAVHSALNAVWATLPRLRQTKRGMVRRTAIVRISPDE